MKNIAWVLMLATLVTVTGCKKDTSADSVNLLDGATEYNGERPLPADVTYLEDGIPVTVQAHPGEFITFFHLSLSEADATQLITANGGSILAKIPRIGYYFVEIDTLQTTAFCSALNANSGVISVRPNTVVWPQAGAYILDFCNKPHGQNVRSALQNCAGTMELCEDMMIPDPFFGGLMERTDDDKVIQAFIRANNGWFTAGGTTLINLSFAGGQKKNFAAQTPAEQLKYKISWRNYIADVMEAVLKLPESMREQLVITISAGNYNAPIGEMMDKLRANPYYADILRKNILIVSTDSLLTNGLKANYAPFDPDVVVLNNPVAEGGTSYAAPCALGYVQSVMQEKGVSASEALKAVKAASWLTPNREVKMGNLLAIAEGKNYMTSSTTLTGYSYINDCKFKMEYKFDNIEVAWNGSTGIIKMPVTLNWSLPVNPTNDCQTATEPSAKTVMYGELTGTDNAITTVTRIAGRFKFTLPDIQGPQIEDIPQFFSLKFSGTKNSNGTITGTIKCANENPSLSFPETLQVTLAK